MTARAPTDGAIAWMARNPVAANLLMALCLLGGLFGITRTKMEVFPDFDLDFITVSVPYPGASPNEVEQGVILAVEEAVRSIDGVKHITSTAGEGFGLVQVELQLGENVDRALSDAKSAVDSIRSFPADVEEPIVSVPNRSQSVISLILSGDIPLTTLHELAEQARFRLLAHPNISQVDLQGVPPLELSVEVERGTLEQLGLSLDDIATQIRLSSIELPGGSVETDAGERLVRVADRRGSADAIRDIVVRANNAGALVRLGDVATVSMGYEDTKQASSFDGHPAVRLVANRSGDETPQAVAEAARSVMAELRAEWPDSVSLDIWDDDSVLLADRIELLVRNGQLGLLLVLIVLALFMDLRLAFWVGLGIPISFLGASMLMPNLGLSINMITLFGFIVTLGMVVDDAIVVGENAFEKTERGVDPLTASIDGAREMVLPVSFAIFTTIAAFSPLFFVPGVMGKIFRLFPMVIVAVLFISLIESFFILPAHLAHSKPRPQEGRLSRLLARPRTAISRALHAFTEGAFSRTLSLALHRRYAAVATGVGAFIVAATLVASGLVPFSFFPIIEGDVVTASARLPYGAPEADREHVRRAMEAARRDAVAGLDASQQVSGTFTKLGEGRQPRGPGSGAPETGSHLVTIEMELVPSKEREFSAVEMAHAWQEAMPPMAGLESLIFSGQSGPASGTAVDLQLSHTDEQVLADASTQLADALRGYRELRNITNTYAAGKTQFDYRLRPEAQTLGVHSTTIARQIRSSFYGAEALREQQGRNEVRIMVRLPAHERRSEFDLDQLRIKTAGGGFAPLSSLAEVTRNRSATNIQRRDGVRVVNVQADLQPFAPSARPILESLSQTVLPEIQQQHPGLKVQPAGQSEAQSESLSALGANYGLAMLAIYALLAVPFRSYTQPLVVMSAIPFGFIGAIVGHLIMGFELSLISVFGIVALSGVVVNDSLVLLDTTNRLAADGATPTEAIVGASKRRLRPILLTSLTTFFGLVPMIFETSTQARFLIPMAVSLGFGILFATVIILLLVPALFLIQHDVVVWLRRLAVGRQ